MTALTRHALLLCICLIAGINSTHASPQEELNNLRKQISELLKELEETSESQSEATDELRESERAISNSKRRLAELSAQHHAADQTLESLQRQSQQLEKYIQKQQTMLSKLLYQQYLGGKQEYFKLLLNNHDPDQTAREMRYYEYIARSRSTWLNMLRTNLAQLDDVIQLTQQKSKEIAALQEEENAQKQTLEKDKLARQHVISQFAQQLKQQRHEIGRLQRDENRLSQLVAKLAKMLTRQKSKGVLNNDKLPDNRFDGKPFEQLKGKLSLPVMGTVVNKFGSARSDSAVSWKGLQLRAASGQPVKSVAAGRVVFADWLRGFGNLLIVDHGKGYMSLYGNNETLFKQVGDILHGGDTIAAVGNSGGNEDYGVYFELRHRGEPIDPIKWIAQ
ncbi:Septal ring factor EnvC, activator of murein hydrolases AmiA and AmiB [Candidatus Nitrotoga sp. BS]|uniref:murein hydrolase activator EnvC family protein n=1 Tax=Candidatus Nitrotoga sp. BS TaxID=2890408 RepID=UPI001EF239C9|nr:peptidoglycan DD-metalloendopeptidase family protein [Candidatus Nitrotoga sp. BS]CAH1211752.1 Septal ring factor EnvC, activator of murein hydrolases AmiA and AmiB [Candidatus Nitrotoga sp. BS]